MPIKDILTWIDDESASFAVAYALALSQSFGAHLTGVALETDLAPSLIDGSIPVKLFDAVRESERERCAAAKARFLAGAHDANVPCDAVTLAGPAVDNYMQLSVLARHFDIAVLPQQVPEKGSQRTQVIEAALFGSGRPALIVPYIWQGGPVRLERALVAWDGGLTAARAIGAAMPILASAKKIEVVTVGEGETRVELPGFDFARHLARHGLEVSSTRLANGIGVANRLLSHAADSGADILIMGGYGHSRFRETLFGGATLGILATMTLPVFMTH
ncbi:universal stress protein [Terrarubrum flagellatum]|uniref:universal stress protein n=1 Tax=Terrirubrum flagellatum TaxID=2895980 RepID=UPI003144FFD5